MCSGDTDAPAHAKDGIFSQTKPNIAYFYEQWTITLGDMGWYRSQDILALSIVSKFRKVAFEIIQLRDQTS